MLYDRRDPRIKLSKTQLIFREGVNLSIISFAALMCAFNLNSFVDTASLVPGGCAGAALLIIRLVHKFMHIQLAYSVVFLPLNAIPIYLGIRFLGKRFTIYSIYYTVLSSLLTDALYQIPITYDKLLICIFGGIINGTVGLLCLWAGGSGGGTDFVSIVLSELKGINAWNMIFIYNAIILGIAGYFFGWDKALYSIIYQFVTTQLYQNFYKRYSQRTLLVITDMPESIYDKIRILTHHDATLFHGEGFFMGRKRQLIYSVIGADQVTMLVKEIRDIDPHAFINVMRTERLEGRFYSRPRE